MNGDMREGGGSRGEQQRDGEGVEGKEEGGREGWREEAREREQDAQAVTHLLYRFEPITTPRLEEIR